MINKSEAVKNGGAKFGNDLLLLRLRPLLGYSEFDARLLVPRSARLSLSSLRISESSAMY
jgi:hypothetical protein